MGAAEKLTATVSVVTLTDEQLTALVRDAVANGVEQALANIGKAAVDSQELPTKDAAKELGMSPAALRHHIARGHIVPDTRGGKGGVKSSKFKRSTIEAFRRRTRGDTEEH